MSRLRILLLAPDATPDGICAPLIGYSQAQALARLHDVTLLVRPSCEEAVRARQGALRSIEVVSLPRVERIYAWTVRRIFKHNYESQYLQVLYYLLCIASEWQAWRQTRAQIMSGEFDIVLRLLPVPAVVPSPFAFFLRNGPIPFVIGPINGGLPWPPGFSHAKRQKQWIYSLRRLYRFLPLVRSTYRRAAAIIAGSSHTYEEFAEHKEKLFFLPENGIDAPLSSDGTLERGPARKIELIFVGALVPRKSCHLALRGAAQLLQKGLGRFTVVGDGPDRSRLEALVRSLGVGGSVTFCGSVKHEEVLRRLQEADVLVFPSVRDFGGGVVFEALAAGVVPVVVDFGGPGDIVRSDVGFKTPLTNEGGVVSGIEEILLKLAGDINLLNKMRRKAISYARDHLTWDAKAKALTEIMLWASRRGPKPGLPPPKMQPL